MKKVGSNLLKKNFRSSFLSCSNDQETIWRKLLVESKPYSDKLKKLLIINASNCLDDTQVQYQQKIREYTIKDMKNGQYIKAVPKLSFGEHEEVKSYILLEFDDFVPTDNPMYRDCVISFSIVCHLDYWEMDDYKLRPWEIAGYIDGILDNEHLSGIGTLQFIGASQLVLSEYLGGVVLRYVATHSKNDDSEKVNPDLPSRTQLTSV
uniref:Uncharacterized protein n=1 Tax=Siphoviridae sp. ctZHD14 TaxID=2827891 RepID=A0A8S5SX03_9CAUD|nr:MAG TPA: hypothetical protein [Siphoviridae sp. ctZHD14]